MKIFMFVLALALGGCASSNLSVTTLEPVCDALIGPIHYSSKNKSSPRYAAPQLAPDLAERNRVGLNLNCPSYTNPPKVTTQPAKPKTASFTSRFHAVWPVWR
jgi:hypothetical protein